MEIKHFDHKHLLWRMYMTRNDLVRCKACSSLCDGRAYVCGRLFCNYALHESCAKLPKMIQSPYHTDHPLLLQRSNIFTSGNCNGCGNKSSGFIFRCNDDKCKFYLDLDCTFKKPLSAIEEGGGKLRTHLNHHHPLLRFKNVPNRNFGCSICGGLFMYNDPLYGCFPCLLFMHRSCFKMKLLPEIKHFYHPHPLTLCTKESSLTCGACYYESTMVWYYNCKQCNGFKMHIACALSALPNKINFEEKKISHFLHDHPLQSKLQVDDGKVVNCCVCGKGCTGPTNTTYVCVKASSSYCKNNIYFHKSCLEFPQQILHLFHPYHPLTLKLSHGDRAHGKYCNACRKPPYEFPHNPATHSHNNKIIPHKYLSPQSNDIIAYICERHYCNFLLHVECSVMLPSLEFEGHSHLLHFRDDNIENSELECGACKSDISESYAFTCLYCDLNLHILCGPIPYEIKHKDHIHPLFLTNSPVEEELEDETDEFYCDVCEEERDLLFRWGKVGLGPSMKHVIVELSEVSRAMRTAATEEYDIYDSEYSEIFLFSDEAYEQFMEFLDSGKGFLDTLEDPEKFAKVKEEFAKVGKYMFPLRLANILVQLLSRHGDVSAKSTLSPMAKLYLFIVLCECMCSMTNTRVVDITKDLILDWWTSLKMLQAARFEIQFAFNHLKRVAHAYFGLYVKKRVENFNTVLSELHKEVQNLQNKIEVLEKKREDIRSAESAKSNLIEECMREATILKHAIASTGLIRIK
ncbi:hypothetical protein CFP56_038903 [Quercus suber]|uniref:DC1 domain-containing protein n=1 Tax=Quercus suber TaxID=58331 RepID=A0AAW0J2C1_QUESU